MKLRIFLGEHIRDSSVAKDWLPRNDIYHLMSFRTTPSTMPFDVLRAGSGQASGVRNPCGESKR
jgi:hypothetical protein